MENSHEVDAKRDKQTGNPLIYARFIRAMSAADTNIGHAYCKC